MSVRSKERGGTENHVSGTVISWTVRQTKMMSWWKHTKLTRRCVGGSRKEQTGRA